MTQLVEALGVCLFYGTLALAAVALLEGVYIVGDWVERRWLGRRR